MTQMLKRPLVLAGLALLLFLALNVIAERMLRPVLIDLTDAGLFSLSDGTRSVVNDLDEPVTLNYYFSRQLAASYPNLLSYGKRVEDMLVTIARVSLGKVNLRVIEPEPFSEIEDEAVAAGLQGVPLGDGTTLYMGLRAENSLDGEAVIPFFSEERDGFLEYDIAKIIQGLGQSDRLRLTLLSRLPMAFGPGGPQAAFQGQSQPYVIYEQLTEFFDVQEITSGFDAVPQETDILMLVHPPALTEDQLYLIDQYVLGGGRLIAFLDPHAESLNPQAFSPDASDLGPLLEAWGLSMPEGQVVGDLAQAQRVSFGGEFGGSNIQDYVFWLGVRPPFLAADDVTTGTLSSINLGSAGVLTPLETELTVTPLMTTSTSSMLYAAERAAGVPDPDSLIRDFQADGQQHILAARVSGEAKTAFPDRVAATTAPSFARATGDIRVVIVSDADMLEDRFWAQTQNVFGQRIAVPIAGNGSFVLNIVDHISGSDALLGLRGRGISNRPFDRVNDMRKAAEARYLAEEQRLQAELEATEARIAELEAGSVSGELVLSAEQEAEVERFRESLIETRRALRDVQRGLRAEIDGLGRTLSMINILLMPLLVVVFGLVRHFARQKQLRAHAEGLEGHEA